MVAMRQLKVSLSNDDIAELEDLSRETGYSISALIRNAVKQWLKTRKEHKVG